MEAEPLRIGICPTFSLSLRGARLGTYNLQVDRSYNPVRAAVTSGRIQICSRCTGDAIVVDDAWRTVAEPLWVAVIGEREGVTGAQPAVVEVTALGAASHPQQHGHALLRAPQRPRVMAS